MSIPLSGSTSATWSWSPGARGRVGEGVVLAASEESFAKAKPDLADVVANTPLVVHEVWRNLNGGASAPPGRVIAWSRPPSGRPRGTGRVPTGLRVWLPWAEVLARHVVSDGCRVLAMGDVAVFAHT